MEQNTQEWLDFRKDKIGASDVPIIMGKSPWCTPLLLWRRKMGLEPEQFSTKAMEYGKNMERSARACFEEDYGKPMEPCVLIHPDRPFFIASLDGKDDESVLEIKCPSNPDLLEKAKEGVIPEHYMLQMQAQMAVSGLSRAYFYVFFEGQTVTLDVERNEEQIEEIYKAVDDFNRRMKELDPPPSDVETRSDSRWIDLAKHYIDLSGKKKQIEDELELTKNMLVEMSYSDSSQGGGIRLNKSLRKGSIQYKDIPELKGLDLDKYRAKDVESWTILINEKYV